MSGNLIHESKHHNGVDTEIDVKRLEKGWYIVNLQSNGKTLTTKLIVK